MVFAHSSRMLRCFCAACVRGPRYLTQIRTGSLLCLHLLLLCGLLLVPPAIGQAPAPKHEFRGVWIATVYNLDWPARGARTDQQKAGLVLMLDRLKDAGINAVFFQIRSESDAMYESSIEPWSYWLTGRQGTPPSPFYDPLAFAIDEAHKRGMELHAWFNPFRARRAGSSAVAANHVTKVHPEWVLKVGSVGILDPGQAAVRDYVTSVVMDVVRRYNIDGVHFDDYFYPYPPNQISTQDAATFESENRGFTSLFDWRRDNVNIFVAQVGDSIRAVKPTVEFGISPFGIWRNGVPAGITGMDAYNVIFADPLAWIKERSIDYLVPQLYWRFGGSQDYALLAPWWAEQIGDLHLYTGNALYRAERATNPNVLFSPDEIPDQIRFNRDYLGILGAVLFRARNVSHFSSQGIVEILKSDLYRHPALTPPMTWKPSVSPEVPGELRADWLSETEFALTWNVVRGAQRYVVYRVPLDANQDPDEAMRTVENMRAVTGMTSYTDPVGPERGIFNYFVTAVGHNSAESGPSGVVTNIVRPTALDWPADSRWQSVQAFPNPFLTSTTIRVVVQQPERVSVSIYNVVGQLVATLANEDEVGPGTHDFAWRPQGAGGAYMVVVERGGQRETTLIACAK